MNEKVDSEMRGVIVSLLDIMYKLGIDEDTARIASSKAGLEEVSGEICAVIARAKAVLAESESNCGNKASMREALEVAKKAICHHARTKHTCDSLAWENSTINANCGDMLCGHRDLCEAKTAIQKALAEPARNCDLHHTKEDAERAFLSEPCDEPCGNCTIKDINNECGVKWLFAKHNKEDK